ncbi:RHS repeat-associated core domain-containing protein [Stenotrophomonas sp.]|uniref:RHS repeat-associated core domain-containing protein n=1 Tax=Stenotrophomonas sp. TaxID=69392 RepID=UPI0028A7C81B|nr:RHS repeat-associated core domain-containing protein [Stenotrophomonas sp.]
MSELVTCTRSVGCKFRLMVKNRVWLLAFIQLHACGELFAADLPPNNPPVATDYCVSTGGCFKSMAEAEAEMNAATPHYSGMMRQSRTIPSGEDGLKIEYAVDNRPPRLLYPAVYQIAGQQNSSPYCPGMVSESDPYFPLLCYSDVVGIEQYKAKFLVNTQQCTFTNIEVVGDYGPTPTWHNPNTPGTSGYVNYSAPYKRLEWDIYCTGWGNVPPDHRSIQVAKFQTYDCPLAFSGVNSTTPEIARLCRPNRSIPYITVRKIRQTDSASANCNPCHPDNGDKSRVEPDFAFAGGSFTRYYHSLRQVVLERAFPAGWTFTYSSRLEFSSRYLITDDGYYAKLHQLPSGSFAVDKSGGAVLNRISDALYELKSASGEIRSFDGNGRLIAIQNLSNPASDVSITYQPVLIGGTASTQLISRVTDKSGRSIQFHYDDARLVAIELPDGELVSYEQDAIGNLVAVDYGNGQVKQYHYGEQGSGPYLLTGITAEDGLRYASFSYDQWGRVVSSVLHADNQRVDGTYLSYQDDQHATVKTRLGEIRSYVFASDFYRSPLSVADSRGALATTHDASGRILSRVDRRGARSISSYTGAQLTSTSDAVGTPDQRTTATDWDAALNVPLEQRVSDAAGTLRNKTQWAYNTRGQALSSTETDPVTGQSRTATTSYCEQADVTAGTCPWVGLVKAEVAPGGTLPTTYIYYPTDDIACATPGAACTHRKGDLWKVSNALGHTAEYLAYDNAGRVTQQKDANGVLTSLTYHPRGWLASRRVHGASAAHDRLTQIEYWPTGLTKRVVEPDGSFISHRYDSAHRLVEVSDNTGNHIQYVLDNAGNRVAENTRDPGGALKRTLSRLYNTLGELVTQADASANPTDYTYDSNGNATTVTDALGRVSRSDYDPLNRLKRSLQDVGGIEAEVQYRYDALDYLIEVTDPKGLKTLYARNAFGEVITQTSPDTGVTAMTYDAAGNMATRTDARGVTATYQYDALNRVTHISYPDPTLDVAYTYDIAPAVCAANEQFSRGRVGTVIHAGGSTQYCHDRFGQLTRKVQTVNGVATTVRYGYTAGGRLAALTYPDGTVADYLRDSLGRISEVGVTRPGQPRQVVVTNVTYAPFGPATGWTYGNGRALQRPVDQDYRTIAVHDPAPGGLSVGYGYDPVGEITELTNGDGTEVLAQYSYDALGRLTQTKDGATGTPIETYGYDATGNRTQLTTNAGTHVYSYPAASHRLTAVDAESRAYDPTGNTLNIGSREYVYSDANRLTQVKQGGAVAESYVYNHRGERIGRSPSGAPERYSAYDEVGQWLGDFSTSGQAAQQVIWLDRIPVALVGEQPEGTSKLAYIQSDHLGAPRLLIDPTTGASLWEWSSKGEVFGSQAPNIDPAGNGASMELALRFPGQQATVASALYYNHQREYDATTGRYSQSDPIGLRGGSSTYSYVGSSPLRYVDPLGLVKWKGYAHGIAGGGGGLALAFYNFHLTSECVGGRMAVVDLDVFWGGGGLGAPVTYTVSNVTLDDGASQVDPNNLTGPAVLYGGGFAAGGGASYSELVLGSGRSDLSWSGQGGWDASLYAYPYGRSRFDGQPRIINCGCER